jgi:hypothetical protein
MIQVTPQMRILVAVEPSDFRKGHRWSGMPLSDRAGQRSVRGCVLHWQSQPGRSDLVYDGWGSGCANACQGRSSPGGQKRPSLCPPTINWLSCCQPAINGSQGRPTAAGGSTVIERPWSALSVIRYVRTHGGPIRYGTEAVVLLRYRMG